MEIECRALAVDKLEADREWWEIYFGSFPEEEREDPAVILESVRRGVGAAIAAGAGGSTVGIAVIHLLRNPPAVFLVYLAAAVCCRGRGIGSQVLEASWRIGEWRLREQGVEPTALVWEVESPAHAGSDAEAEVRARRIRFFQRKGGLLVPATYWQPPLSGGEAVPMRLMVRPASDRTTVPGDPSRSGWRHPACIDALVRAIYCEKYGEVNCVDGRTLERLLEATKSSR